MNSTFRTAAWLMASFQICQAQAPSDAAIQSAINSGSSMSSKRLTSQWKKDHEVRMNRASFSDPIEKKVAFLTDLDRISFASSEASRKMMPYTIVDARKLLIGYLAVMLEANCYNSTYASSLPKWTESGGIHLVLRVGDKIVQPAEKVTGDSDAVWFGSLYERTSFRTWFAFPNDALTSDMITVIAISGEGVHKEKEVHNPLK